MSEFPRCLAFIVGINQYDNGIQSLQSAVNDAKKLAEILQQKHQYKVVEFLDNDATLEKLHHLLETTLPQEVMPDDQLLFYFAGHGVALNGKDGPEGYLIPQDAKQGNVQTYLRMTKVQEFLEKLPCRHFLGILDCCYAGAFRWGSTRDLLSVPEVIHKERYERFMQDPAWQVITSTASTDTALDADPFALIADRGQLGEHSPFAAALFDALSEGPYLPAAARSPAWDGVVTATSLGCYLRDRVELATEERRQRQTPGIWSLKKHDKGEYIFLTPGHQLNLPPAPPLDKSKNPYRGLESFDVKHRDLFFGREAIALKLHEFVTTHPLTIVIGASGSGKSSLVKAGLIPQAQDEKWYVVPPIRPGKSPFVALHRALDDAHLPKGDISNTAKSLIERLTDWASYHPNFKLLLVIDQCEELITLCENHEERKAFLNGLAEALTIHPNT